MKTVGYPFKLIAAIVLIVATPIAACWVLFLYDDHLNYNPHSSETTEHMIERFRSEADETVRESCKQDIPRVREVTSVQTYTSGKDCNKWTADASAEYYDSNGGINVTNLHFTFRDDNKTLHCVAIPGWY